MHNFAQRLNTEILGIIPRDDNIQKAEDQGMTVEEMDSQLPISLTFQAIAKKIMDGGVV